MDRLTLHRQKMSTMRETERLAIEAMQSRMPPHIVTEHLNGGRGSKMTRLMGACQAHLDETEARAAWSQQQLSNVAHAIASVFGWGFVSQYGSLPDAVLSALLELKFRVQDPPMTSHELNIASNEPASANDAPPTVHEYQHPAGNQNDLAEPDENGASIGSVNSNGATNVAEKETLAIGLAAAEDNDKEIKQRDSDEDYVQGPEGAETGKKNNKVCRTFQSACLTFAPVLKLLISSLLRATNFSTLCLWYAIVRHVSPSSLCSFHNLTSFFVYISYPIIHDFVLTFGIQKRKRGPATQNRRTKARRG